MSYEQSLTLAAIGRIAIRQRVLLAVTIVLCGLLAVAYSLITRPVYRAEVLLAPAQNDAAAGGLGALLGQFGGLASIAGISTPGGHDKQEAIATLGSQLLTSRFVEEKDLLPILFANDWDPVRHNWKTSDPAGRHTVGDACRLFDDRIRQVREDLRTGLVTLRIDWYDRNAAAEWANELVDRGNAMLRQRALAEADRSLDYLNREAAKATTVELRDAIYRLIEGQSKARMLASIRTDYAFTVIDPAVAPDPSDRLWPKRKLIVVAGVLGGALLGLLLAIARDRRRKSA